MANQKHYKTKREIQISGLTYSKGTVKTEREWCKYLQVTPKYFQENYMDRFVKVRPTTSHIKSNIPNEILAKALDHIILHSELFAVREEKAFHVRNESYEKAAALRKKEVALMNKLPKLKELKLLRENFNKFKTKNSWEI